MKPENETRKCAGTPKYYTTPSAFKLCEMKLLLLLITNMQKSQAVILYIKL